MAASVGEGVEVLCVTLFSRVHLLSLPILVPNQSLSFLTSTSELRTPVTPLLSLPIPHAPPLFPSATSFHHPSLFSPHFLPPPPPPSTNHQLTISPQCGKQTPPSSPSTSSSTPCRPPSRPAPASPTSCRGRRRRRPRNGRWAGCMCLICWFVSVLIPACVSQVWECGGRVSVRIGADLKCVAVGMGVDMFWRVRGRLLVGAAGR